MAPCMRSQLIHHARNLLPSDNFSESGHTCPRVNKLTLTVFAGFLTSASADSRSSSMNGSFASDAGQKNISGFKIKTVTRGFTEEADKLLDYMVRRVDWPQ